MNKIPDKNNLNAMKSMFNEIAQDYDFLNDIMTLYLQKSIKKIALKSLKPKHNNIIDICTGTGDIAIMLADKYPTANITAIDFSDKMLNLAKQKSKNLNINFIEGNAINIPFSNNFFDLCTISFGLRNLPDINTALKEFYRIMSEESEILVLDLGEPSFQWLYPVLLNKIIPLIGKIFHKNKIPYQYLVESKKNYPSPQKLSKILQSEGFTDIKIKNFLFGTISALTAKKS